MTTTLYQDIRGALQNRLGTVPGLPTVAYEAIRYTPVPGTPYVEVMLIPGQDRPVTNGDTGKFYLHEGAFQLTLVYPSGKGTAAVEAMADLIRSYFTAGLSLTLNSATVRIRYAERQRAVPEADWVRLPVSIGWYLHSTTT